MASFKLADSAIFQPAPTVDSVTTFSAEVDAAAEVNLTSTYFETDVIGTIEIETEEEDQFILLLEIDLTEIGIILMISLALVLFFKFLKSKSKNSTVKFIEAGKSENAEQVNRCGKKCVENGNETVYRLASSIQSVRNQV